MVREKREVTVTVAWRTYSCFLGLTELNNIRYHHWEKDLKNVHYNLHYYPMSYSERALV